MKKIIALLILVVATSVSGEDKPRLVFKNDKGENIGIAWVDENEVLRFKGDFVTVFELFMKSIEGEIATAIEKHEEKEDEKD